MGARRFVAPGFMFLFGFIKENQSLKGEIKREVKDKDQSCKEHKEETQQEEEEVDEKELVVPEEQLLRREPCVVIYHSPSS